MDDSMKKALEDARRLQTLVPDSLAEQVKKLAGFSTLAELAKQHESSVLTHAQKLLADFNVRREPAVTQLPYIEPPSIPRLANFEDSNAFQSSAVLLRRLAESIRQWRRTLPDELQPAVLALLNGGVQIDVTSLAQECFHGIRIEGQIQGAPCVVLAHQSTVQLLCIAQPVIPPETPRRPIGFVIEGEPSEA